MSSIYVHFPYCIQKCPYCAFVSFAKSDFSESSFVELIAKEFELRREAFDLDPLESVFFGGGTPSLLSVRSVEKLLKLFQPNADTEVTIECNPGTIEEDLSYQKLCGFKSSGVTRLSFGAQSFCREKLKLLGRWHEPEQIETSVALARQAGFDHINIDLIFATAADTLRGWECELERALSLEIDHLSAYSLSIEKGTEFHKSNRPVSANEEVFADQFKILNNLMTSNGFKHYEISNFYKDTPCKHNQNYWLGSGYLGLGPSAAGYNSKLKRRYRNSPSIEDYTSKLARSTLPESSSEILEEAELKIEYLFLRLRTAEGISREEYRRRFGQDLVINKDHREMLEITQEYVKPKLSAFLLSDSLVSEIISYN